MELTRYKGIEIEGFVFDGTFESSVAIAEVLRERYTHRVRQFNIVHYNHGSRLGETILSFTIIPPKTDPNGRDQEFKLNVGDLLRVQPNAVNVITRGFLQAYWVKI